MIWGREQVGYNDHLLNPMGPSWRLNRARFDDMLATAAVDRGIEVQWETRYLGVRSADGFVVSLASEREESEMEVEADWVVDASGPRARLARDLGVGCRVDDYIFGLAAFSGIRSGPVTQQVLVEAVPDGWWYAARLPDERMVCMYVSEATEVRAIKSKGVDGWKAGLSATRLVGPALSGLELGPWEFHTFPIYSSLLEQGTGRRWLAVGDAAACYDPIASQGLYKALSDGVLAGRALGESLKANADFVGEAYAMGIRERYTTYFAQRSSLYEQEQRWPGSAFWLGRSRGRDVAKLIK